MICFSGASGRRIAYRSRPFQRWAAALGMWACASLASSCAHGPQLGEGQLAFSTPEEAVSELIAALRADNVPRLEALLGVEGEDIIDSGDQVTDRADRQHFVELYDKKHALQSLSGDALVLQVGDAEWPLPLPIVRAGASWFFDTEEGRQEILNRRIGKNELDAIQVCLAIVDAERDYARVDRDGDGILEYAAKIRSSEGKTDGLYWEAKEGEEPSPLGDLVAHAVREGYGGANTDGPRPYHGYLYKILLAQGPHAPGGAYDYVVRGDMIGGFALLASPAEYGNSGVMSFIVNHDGRVYERDLGEDTEKAAGELKVFEPDEAWKPVATESDLQASQ